MSHRNKTFTGLVVLLALVMALAVWGAAGAQDTSDNHPFLGIGLKPAENGIEIQQLFAGGPAETAGAQIGDIITGIDGKAVTADSIRTVLSGYAVGDTIKLDVTRGSETMELSATLAAQPERGNHQGFSFSFGERAALGVRLENTDNGVVIREVVAGSAAEKAGLKVGDIITKIGESEIKTAQDAAEAIQQMSVGDEVEISLTRDGSSQTISATLEAAQGGQLPFNRFDRELGFSYNESDKSWTIRRLNENSPLYEAGLREGDVVKTFDGTAYDPAGLLTYIQGLDTTKDITLSVERDGSTQDITITSEALQNLGAFGFAPFGRDGDFSFPFERGGEFPFDFGQVMGRIRLGVEFVTLNEETAQENNITQTEGALVTNVLKDSAADKAGLKVDDIITAVDGDKVDAEHTLRDRLVAYEAGDSIMLDVLRGGETTQISVTLEQIQFNFDFNNLNPRDFFHFFGPDSFNGSQEVPATAPNA